MQILEYGNSNNDKVILIHGFQMHLDSLKEYIKSLEKNYFVIVPILPCHDRDDKEKFVSFDKCLSEFENYYINKYGSNVYAIIAFSMGGVFASLLWEHKKINIQKLLMESSPLLKWNNFIINMMTKQYINLTNETKKRNPKIVEQATHSIVRKENLDSFLLMMDNMDEESIKNYIREVGLYNLPKNIDTPNTEIFYSYGGKFNEFIFKKVGKYIKNNYANSHITCIKGKGHCEDAIFDPSNKAKEIIKILKR